jgi:hypothetical protein
MIREISCDIYSTQINMDGPAVWNYNVNCADDILSMIDSIELQRAMLDLYIDIYELNEENDIWECVSFSKQGCFNKSRLKEFVMIVWNGAISDIIAGE